MKYIKKITENYLNTREIVFTHKRNRTLTITITITPDGFIDDIINDRGVRFPFSKGQRFQRNIESWACNNDYLMNGEDTCPEEKIFGIRVSDIPQGHELRYIYPNKFKK
jgi:hypothetical protein